MVKRATEGGHQSREQYEAQDDDNNGGEEGASRTFSRASDEGKLLFDLDFIIFSFYYTHPRFLSYNFFNFKILCIYSNEKSCD